MPARQYPKVQGFSYIKRQKFRADLCLAQEVCKFSFPLVFLRGSKAKSMSILVPQRKTALIVVFFTDGEAGTCAEMLLKLIIKEWI